MSEYNRNSSGGRNFEHRGLEGGTLSSYSRAGHSSTGHRSSSGTSSHTKSTDAHTSTGRRDTVMNRAAAGRSHTSGRYKKKRRNRLDITQILLIVIGVLAVILIAAIASRGCGGGSAAGGATESDIVQESTVADGAVTVNGVNIYGMTQEEARKAILDSFDWKMKAKYEDKETDVTNLMADKVDQLLEEIYASDLKPGETYEVNTENMIEDAKAVEEAGAFLLVLECVPAKLAKLVTESINIPTIGIGAGAGCDGQVLVIYDMLGMFSDFKPKFVKHFANAGDMIREAVKTYIAEIDDGTFPAEEHCYKIDDEVIDKLY